MSQTEQVTLTLSTTEDIGNEEFARAFLRVLGHFGADWLPERFATAEPLKQRFDPQAPDEFVGAWLTTPRLEWQRGSLVFKTSSNIGAWVTLEWRRAWNHSFNTIVLTAPHNKLHKAGFPRLLALAQDLSTITGACYGNIRGTSEFAAQHRTKRDDLIQGVDLSKHIPGVYFANFFGRPLVEFLGQERFESCPAVVSERLEGGGWLLTTTDEPATWNTEAALDLKERIRRHLGERAFFDIRLPGRSTIAPFYDFRKVRIGERPQSIPVPSVAAEFFATTADTRHFINQVLVLCDQLRTRLGSGNALDFTPESLRVVDDYVVRAGPLPDVDKRSVVLEGTAYFGEVLRRTMGAWWRVDDRDPLMPSVVFATGETEYPLVRAVKLVEGADRLSDWHDFLTRGGRRLLV